MGRCYDDGQRRKQTRDNDITLLTRLFYLASRVAASGKTECRGTPLNFADAAEKHAADSRESRDHLVVQKKRRIEMECEPAGSWTRLKIARARGGADVS